MNHVQKPSKNFSKKVKVCNNHDVANSQSFPDEMVSSTKAADVEPGSIIQNPFNSPYSVMIGRSRACRESVGNKRLEVFAKMIIPQYETAKSRVEKSMLVTGLVDKVINLGGSFVKVINGDWCQASNLDAREKVGCVIRNLLADKYKSSCKSKVAARKRRSSSSASQEQLRGADQLSTTATSSTKSTSSDDNNMMDSFSAAVSPNEVHSNSTAPEAIVSSSNLDNSND